VKFADVNASFAFSQTVKPRYAYWDVLMEIEEHWETSRKFMDVAAYHEWRKDQ
jgi:hypothetical protein